MMQTKKPLSIEFFPPKSSEGREKLLKTAEEFRVINPEYISVTFGAGGSTQQGTIETVKDMLAAGYDAAPHLSCIGASRESILELLQLYQQMGVKRIVALRGDMPSGMREPGAFHYANELVTFIRQETGDHFKIEVAAYPEFHPQAESAQADIKNFVRKVNAGANAAITQYFYSVDAYSYFVDECQRKGVDIPIFPGIMPITNIKSLARFSEMCGADIPRWLRKRLESYQDDMESLKSFGLDYTTRLCQELLSRDAPGLHFYSMNQSAATLQICSQI